MDINLLPIGSVISLKDAKKRLMIVGVSVYSTSENKKFDYAGILFPEGFMDQNHMILFSHQDIEKIHGLGYINAEMQAFRLAFQNIKTEKENKNAE